MTSEAELHEGLRRVAARLEEASGAAGEPVTPGVRREPVAPPAARPLLAVAAVAALLVGLVALLVTDREDESVRTDVPSSVSTAPAPGPTGPESDGTTPGTTTSGPVVAPSYEGMAWDQLPGRGLAVVDDGRVALLDLGGIELASFAAADLPGIGNDPAEPVLVGAGGTVELGEPGIPEAGGCSSSGRGGVRVAICGADQEELVRLSPAGEATALAGRPFGAALGRWRVAAPSPDGRWVLGTFSVECEVPFAVLVPADGGEPRTADGFADLGGDAPPVAASSYSVGWTDAGQAVVVFPESACGSSAPDPGTYLVDPDTGARSLLRPGTPERVIPWERVGTENDRERAFSRAAAELGLETCCGEPAHGGGGVTSGVVWQGVEVTVGGGDVGPVTIEPGEGELGGVAPGQVDGLPVTTATLDGRPVLAFTCGDTRWVLGTAADPALLADVASALIPRLACTVGEPPAFATG